MTWITRILILLFVCTQLVANQSDEYINRISLDVINSNDGLSSDMVYSVYQDSEGFLWFCTEDGLNKYDGYTSRIYKPEYTRENTF